MATIPPHAWNHLVRHLQAREWRGQTRVSLSETARAFLARIDKGEIQSAGKNVVREPVRATDTRKSAMSRGCRTDPKEDSMSDTVQSFLEEAPVAPVQGELEIKRGSPVEKLQSIRETLTVDGAVQSIATLRDTMVFSTGNPSADLMIIGEAPGQDEEKHGEPFVGKAGRLLTKILATAGWERSEVYISNIVKYRPGMPNQGSRNRPPSDEEMAPFRRYLMAEIAVVQPRVIVLLGGSAMRGLTGETTPVGRIRGRFRLWNQIPMIVTYHPSYLLRNPATSEKRKVWEDIMLVMQRLEKPVSRKQKGYFLGR